MCIWNVVWIYEHYKNLYLWQKLNFLPSYIDILYEYHIIMAYITLFISVFLSTHFFCLNFISFYMSYTLTQYQTKKNKIPDKNCIAQFNCIKMTMQYCTMGNVLSNRKQWQKSSNRNRHINDIIWRQLSGIPLSVHFQYKVYILYEMLYLL